MDERRDLWWPSPTVERASVVDLEIEGGFEAVHGGRLEQIQVSYQSWGDLNDARDNAVLVIHPLAMDCHVTGTTDDDPPGWWEGLFGPGRVIDTGRYFVVCPNLLGGCYGTTGPRFPADDGEPWLDRFPLLTPLDLMRVQRLFVERLGIERLNRVIGPSMGGMIAWEWAIEGGDIVDQVVVVAAPLRTTAYQIGLNWLQRRGIELDIVGDEVVARWGQMIARGVGMLSYRSALGVEEKFGRDWFKKPGSTMAERGRFNVESWLRHHGKKITRRFDPYTYILFSRAMDLHDVGERRGGFVTALDRVRCPVVVVGISSDELYPSSEVRLGADILDRLGRPVSYAEIRSPHGHDAFVLETDQMAAILAETPHVPPGPVPVTPEREERLVRVGILGAGRVSSLLLQLLDERRRQIRDDFDLRVEIAAVAEIDPDKKLDPVFDEVEVLYDPPALVKRDDLDVVLDLTRGTGSLELVRGALERGKPVVTPNKSLIRAHGGDLERLALDHGVRIAYHNAIAAGWPLLYSVERPLGREHVSRIRALLSSTCNVALERVEQGDSLAQGLEVARAMGITDPDLELDTSGWDTAQKLMILVARAHGIRFGVEAVAMRGIVDLDPEIVRGAPALGFRVRLVGIFVADEEAPVLGVLPTAVRAEGHFGGVHGETNVVVIDGGEAGEMVYLGKGTGDLPVATAVLGDLVGLYHPSRSWTGRYRSATRPSEPPEFTHFMGAEFSTVSISDVRTEGAVPVLESLVHPQQG
jgi:homoserine O-acetyltransferase